MARVKICGIRRQEDISFVNKYKPDYIGFIFAESKRRVGIETAKELTGQLDAGIMTVGVFVDEKIRNIVDTAVACDLDVVQIHGDESPEYVDNLRNTLAGIESRTKVWKAVRVKNLSSIEQMKDYSVDAFVLDAYADGLYGGVGKTFDWSLAIEAGKYGNIILAGGLNAQNIQEAIQTVRPYGVDISSGVETDGFKDEEKIKEFIYKTKEWGE